MNVFICDVMEIVMKCFIVLLFMFCCVLKDFELWLCEESVYCEGKIVFEL